METSIYCVLLSTFWMRRSILSDLAVLFYFCDLCVLLIVSLANDDVEIIVTLSAHAFKDTRIQVSLYPWHHCDASCLCFQGYNCPCILEIIVTLSCTCFAIDFDTLCGFCTFRMANLVYMRHFHLAKSSDDDEFGFYLATVEAALEHIKSGYISEDMKVNKPKVLLWFWTYLLLLLLMIFRAWICPCCKQCCTFFEHLIGQSVLEITFLIGHSVLIMQKQ